MNECPYPTANCGSGAKGCTTKLLDDPANCGSCGHDCLGGGCLAGKCQATVVVPGTSLDGAIFPTDSKVWWVYWNTQSGYATVYGGVADLETLKLKTFGEPNEGDKILVADDSAAYVSTLGSVRRIPSDASPKTTILDRDAREAILVGKTFYFLSRKVNYVEETGEVYESGPTTIYSVPSGGSKKVVVSMPEASGGLSGMHEDGGSLYFLHLSKPPGIVRVPSTGGALEDVVEDAHLQALVGIEDGAVYYSTFDEGLRVVRFDLKTRESKEIGKPLSSDRVDVLMDHAAFYWIDPNLGVRTMPREGGVPVTTFNKPQNDSGGVENLAQNSRALYWTIDESSPAIYQLAK